MIRIGFLYTRLRVEEKYYWMRWKSTRSGSGPDQRREYVLRYQRLPEPVDVLFERSISYSRGLYIRAF